MKPKSLECGFTLLELLTVMVIIAVLIGLLVPVTATVRARAEKATCINNLRSLYVAAGAYVAQNNHWPQVNAALIKTDRTQYSRAWIDALAPFGVGRKNWICPSLHKVLGAPDYEKNENSRVDYHAMPFDKNPETPYKWPKQPWFIEAGSGHGNGQLIISTDGSVRELNDLIVRGIDRIQPISK